jgi:hypothetical protein
LGAGAAIGVGVTTRLGRAGEPGTVVATIQLEPGYALASLNLTSGIPTRTAIAISSDGRFVVYSAHREGTTETRLFLRRLD